MDELQRNRNKFDRVKKLSIFRRWKCQHDLVYLGIDNQYKVYGCLKCGKYKLN